MEYGKLVTFEHVGNRIMCQFEAQKLELTFITPDVVNVFVGLRYADHFSRAVVPQPECEVTLTCEQGAEFLQIQSESLEVRVFAGGFVDIYDAAGELLVADYRGERHGFDRRGINDNAESEGHKLERSTPRQQIEVIKTMQGDERFYGLGDKTGFLNKRGYAYEMWNTDDPSPHVESHKALYKAVPFFTTLRESGAFGIFFDNTFKSYFDMGKENADYYYFGANDGNLDYYFINGPEMTEVLRRYTQLTGRSPLPQLWTLGYQQSRWSYENEDRVRELVKQFRDNEIPLDVVHLDIDYMDAFKIFTWDKARFPNPEQMITDFASEGTKIVTIIDPAIKKEKGYFAFDEGVEKGYFATDKDGVTYINKVWPGDSAYPDFSNPEVRTWWADHLGSHVATGLAGIWNDMNEPASFEGELPQDVQFNNDGRPSTHAEVHNIYGHLMCEATYDGLKKATNKRPFVITRGAYAGSQRYTTFWTGDNHSFWDHLRLAIPQQLNLGMSGFSLVGTDVGGFGSDTTPELLIRWTQVGAFSPLFRNHSSVLTRSQEPYAFDTQTMSHVREAIRLRYRLLPYFYDLLWQMQTTGLPIMRPLVLHYPTDVKVQEMNSQFMVGEQLVVAPIIEQGASERLVYLPQGVWFDYWTGREMSGGQSFIAAAQLGDIPMYVKAGSVIPHYPVQNYVGELTITDLKLDVFAGVGSYVHYEDDGESFAYENGCYTETVFTTSKNSLEITSHHAGYSTHYTTLTLTLVGETLASVHVDGHSYPTMPTARGVKIQIPITAQNVTW